MKNEKLLLWLFSSVLGIGWGIFAHSYWLLSNPRLTGRFLAIAIAGIVFAASIFHFLAFSRLLLPFWRTYGNRQRFWLILVSAGIGAWMFFVGTGAWDRPLGYLVPFLPRYRLELVVNADQQGEQDASLLLTYFSTSIGEVPFSKIHYRGWQRKDKYTLILTSWNNSYLSWEGRIGEKIFLDFVVNNFSRPAELILKWSDGKEESIKIAKGKIHYSRRFNVPWFASRSALFGLGIFLFGFLAATGYVVVVKNYSAWYQWVEGQLTKKDMVSRKEVALLLGVWVLSLVLRGFYLDSLPPYIDEYAHLLAAKKLLSGVPLNEVYQRSLWITTLPVFLAFRLLGPVIWSARLPGVIVNSLAIFPLYWLMRRIHSWIAVASILLYATSPWIIATSRHVREYAYYPFYFYTIAVVMAVLLEQFYSKRWKINRVWFFLGIMFLSLFLFYAILVDKQSTFKAVIIAYGLLAIFTLWKILEFLPHPFWRFLCFFLVLIVIASIMFWKFGHFFTLLSPEYLYRLKMFLAPSMQQWYFKCTLLLISLLWIASVGFAFFFWKQALRLLFVSALFILYFMSFVFFFARYSRPRYLTFVQIWYIPFLAIGMYALWSYMRVSLRRVQTLFLAALMFIVSVNPIHILRPGFWRPLGLQMYLEANISYITEEYLYELAPAHHFLVEHVLPADALVATMYASYVEFLGEPNFGAVLKYQPGTPMDDIIRFAKQYPSGWIVLDASRKPKELPFDNVIWDNISVQYLGKFGDVFIWRWQKR